MLEYDKDSSDFHVLNNVSEALAFKESNKVCWINVDGIHDVDVVAKLGEDFGIHPLLLEDVLNTRQRPKTEEYDECIFVSIKMLGISVNRKQIMNEQLSFVLGPSWVISFQEQEGDLFDGIRNRIQDSKSLIRKNGPDFLLYRLIDRVVDNYFFVAEFFGESLEDLEERVLENPDTESLHQIQRIKKLLVQFKRSVSPMREVIGLLEKDNHPFIKKNTKRYLRDLYEHIIQVNEAIEAHRDLISGVTDLHSSGVSNKMNQVMKVLTIISTIFIPMTFIAGIYGMNFELMPELKWEYGYLYVWVLILAILVAMVVFFKTRKWL